MYLYKNSLRKKKLINLNVHDNSMHMKIVVNNSMHIPEIVSL